MCRASILNFKPSRNLLIHRINHRPAIQVNPLLAGGRSVWRISQATRVRILQPTEASFLRLYSFPFSGPALPPSSPAQGSETEGTSCRGVK